MFRQMLLLHWKAARSSILVFSLGAFALPLISIQGFGEVPVGRVGVYEAAFLLESQQFWLPFYPILALLCGVIVGLTAWAWDHEANHVYALSLPLSRWEYALRKLGTASVIALVPVGALWLGSMVATLAVTVPAGLTAYPHLLTFRFVLATLLSTGIMFALMSGTKRTAGIVAGVFFGALFLGEIATDVLGNLIPALDHWSFGDVMIEALVNWPGPFEVFTGNWMLIDV